MNRRNFLKMSVLGLMGTMVGCDDALQAKVRANKDAQYEYERENLFMPFVRETQKYYLVSAFRKFNEEWNREHLYLGLATAEKGKPTMWVEYARKDEKDDSEVIANMNKQMTCSEISKLGNKRNKIVSFADGHFKFFLVPVVEKEKKKSSWWDRFTVTWNNI